MEELHYFEFFKSRIEGIGRKLNERNYKKNLTPIDIHLGAYSILKTLKGEVILGTQDNLLASSTQRVYDTAIKVFKERKLSNRRLYIAKTCQDLESALDDIKKLRNERRIESEMYRSDKETFGFAYSSPS